MATIGELFVKLKADTSNFDKGMDDATRKSGGFKSTLGGVKNTLKGILAYDIGKTLVNGFVNATKAGIDYNATLETSSIKWETLLGTQKEANKMLKDIEKFAATTPFEKMGVEAMATQLHNAGFRGQELFNQLTKFGDMAGAFGVQADSLQEMVRQYSQVQQAGVAYTEDLNILQDRGIPIYKAIAEQLGINTADVKKWASQGKISSEIYQSALDSISKSVEGGMEKQSKSFSGMVSTLKDNMGQAMGILSQPIFDKLKEGLQNVLPLMDDVIGSLSENGLMGTIQKFAPEMMPFVQAIIDTFNNLKDNVKLILDSISAFWEEHGGWITQVASVAWGLISFFVNNAINAIGQIVQSGLSFVDGVINFFQNLFQGNFSGCWESIKQIFKSALTFVWNWMSLQFTVNIPNMIKNFGTNFKSFIGKAWEGVKKFFKDGASNVLQAAKSGFTNVFNAVKEWMGKVPGEVSKFMGQAVNKIKSINLFQIGKDLIQGLINGIKNMGSSVAGAIGNVVNGAINKAKKMLGINSPSKLFTQFGRWTGEGLAIGIESEESRVSKASEGLTTSVIGGYNANLSHSLKYKKAGANSNSNVNESRSINLNIENFNNNRTQDVKDLVEEIAFYLKRKNIAIGG